jgi:uncharacterized membrane protein
VQTWNLILLIIVAIAVAVGGFSAVREHRRGNRLGLALVIIGVPGGCLNAIAAIVGIHWLFLLALPLAVATFYLGLANVIRNLRQSASDQAK